MTQTPPLVEKAGWPLWMRLAFRYACLHWLLYAMPSPLSRLFSSMLFYLGKIEKGLNGDEASEAAGDAVVPLSESAEAVVGLVDAAGGVDLTSWAKPVSKTLANISGENLEDAARGTENGWWRDLTTWTSECLASLNADWAFEVHHQGTGSGDTTHDWVKFGCIIVIALFGTMLWSLLDRRKCGHPVLGRWVHLAARWYLALVLLGYGMAKFYYSQFPEPGISGLTREIGDHSPMGMVWTFMGVSTPYKYMSGIGEILGFALLLHRRTTLMGSFLTLAVMGNICALNLMYGVPVKLFSMHLWLIAVVLMAPYMPRLWALFISNHSSEPIELRVVQKRWLAWPMLVIGMLGAIGPVWQGHESRMMMLERFAERAVTPELFGLYKVEKMLLDGVELPSSDSSKWRFLAIDRRNRAWAKTLLGTQHSFKFEEDLEKKTVGLTPMTGGEKELWSYESSTVMRKVRHPSPSTMEEYRTPFDGERDVFVWKGKWDGKELELHTVKKVFRIHDGFRLIREFPR